MIVGNEPDEIMILSDIQDPQTCGGCTSCHWWQDQVLKEPVDHTVNEQQQLSAQQAQSSSPICTN